MAEDEAGNHQAGAHGGNIGYGRNFHELDRQILSLRILPELVGEDLMYDRLGGGRHMPGTSGLVHHGASGF